MSHMVKMGDTRSAAATGSLPCGRGGAGWWVSHEDGQQEGRKALAKTEGCMTGPRFQGDSAGLAGARLPALRLQVPASRQIPALNEFHSPEN